jgi:hypothetical protein
MFDYSPQKGERRGRWLDHSDIESDLASGYSAGPVASDSKAPIHPWSQAARNILGGRVLLSLGFPKSEGAPEVGRAPKQNGFDLFAAVCGDGARRGNVSNFSRHLHVII